MTREWMSAAASLTVLVVLGPMGPTVHGQAAGTLDGREAWWSERRPSSANDGEWRWELGGVASVHLIRYGKDNAKTSGLETESLAPILQGWRGDDLHVWIEPDLDGEDTPRNLSEAWVEWTLGERRFLKAGQFKLALGSEFATRAEDLPLVGYAFHSYLDGRTDTGVKLDGHAGSGFWYEAAATTGHGFGLEGRLRGSPQVSFRGVFLPSAPDGGPFEGLFGGAALAWSPEWDDPIELATPIEQTVFTTPDLDGDAALWFHPELGYRKGRLRAGWEGIKGQVSGVSVGGGAEEDIDQLTAWTAYVAWNLRGVAPRWQRGRWMPYELDGSAHGGDLPLELAVRYSNADIDRKLFDFGITSFNPSSQETRTISAALTGYPDATTRLALEWVFVIADDALSTFGGTNRGNSLVLRIDKRF